VAPRKKSTEAAKKLYRKKQPFACESTAAWGGWINIHLDETQKQAAQDWMEENSQHGGEMLGEIIGAGVKMTVAYDMEHDCWICSFTGALSLEDDARYTCTTRAGSMVDATLLATYKHVFVAKGDYTKFISSGDNFPVWG